MSYGRRLFIIYPEKFFEWVAPWRKALTDAGWECEVSSDPFRFVPAVALAAADAFLFLNVWGHLDDEQVKLVDYLRNLNAGDFPLKLGFKIYFKESWAKGQGVGPNHSPAVQQFVEHHLGRKTTSSPVNAVTGSVVGSRKNLDLYSHLLPPVGTLRSSIISSLEEHEQAMLRRVNIPIIAEELSGAELLTKSRTPDNVRTIAEWAALAHSNARDKGWWDAYTFVDPDKKKKIIPLSAHEVLGLLMLAVGEAGEAAQEVRQPGFDAKEVYFKKDGQQISYSFWEETYEAAGRPSHMERPKPEGFGVEVADTILRLLDLTEALGVDVERAMVLKHAYNKTRPHLHGGKRA